MAFSDDSGSDTRTQDELLDDLRYGPPERQSATLNRLAAIGQAEALDAVIEYLYDLPAEQRFPGLEPLRVLAHKFMPTDRYMLAEALLPFLQDDNWKHRLIAAQLLNAYPNELVVDSMRILVDDAREKVADEYKRRFSPARMIAERTLAESIMALANCGGLRVLDDILDLLDDPALRIIATRAIGMIGSETERDRLMEDLMEDENVYVRDAAHWALNLMDERQEMFMRPPDQQPQPPPDRLSPLYWMHRQLDTGYEFEDCIQYLVVRIAIEHLMLDAFIADRRVPEKCHIVLRRYEGDEPPIYRENRSEVTGRWMYYWDGPQLVRAGEEDDIKTVNGKKRPRKREGHITISCPPDLESKGEGLVSFDCLFGPFMGRGWLYRVTRREGIWSFALVRRTWAS